MLLFGHILHIKMLSCLTDVSENMIYKWWHIFVVLPGRTGFLVSIFSELFLQLVNYIFTSMVMLFMVLCRNSSKCLCKLDIQLLTNFFFWKCPTCIKIVYSLIVDLHRLSSLLKFNKNTCWNAETVLSFCFRIFCIYVPRMCFYLRTF